jgi:hypothetical protein
MVHSRDAANLVISQLAMDPVNEMPELAGVDEEDFAASIAVFVILFISGQEPKAGRNLSRVEELAGEGDHAINQVGFDNAFPNFAFAGLVRGHGSVGEDEAGDAGGR